MFIPILLGQIPFLNGPGQKNGLKPSTSLYPDYPDPRGPISTMNRGPIEF